jgi:hypothetical protein
MISIKNTRKIKNNAQILKGLCNDMITETNNAITDPTMDLSISSLLNQILVIKSKAQDIYVLLNNINELNPKYILQHEYKINEDDTYKLIGITENNAYVLKDGASFVVMSVAELEKYNVEVV